MRWAKFNTVGALGVLVQAGALGVLINVLGVHYLIATPLAVEIAILHNFVWHLHWTFPDRLPDGGRQRRISFTPVLHQPSSRTWVRALCRFQLTAGIVSIPGNMLMMWLFVEGLQAAPVLANLGAIVVCSSANYLLAERFSFRHTSSGR